MLAPKKHSANELSISGVTENSGETEQELHTRDEQTRAWWRAHLAARERKERPDGPIITVSPALEAAVARQTTERDVPSSKPAGLAVSPALEAHVARQRQERPALDHLLDPPDVPVTVSPELEALVARQRQERPEFDHLPPLDAEPTDESSPPRMTRNQRRHYKHGVQRAAQWKNRLRLLAAERIARRPGQAEEIKREFAEEMEEGPDYAQVHAEAQFIEPPKNCTDRNFLARLMFVARMIENKTWLGRQKGKGKHGGELGRTGLVVLQALLFDIPKKGGRLFPCYEVLASYARMSKQTAVNAVAALVRMGLLTVHQRRKFVGTPFGPRVVQDSNAYEYHLPKSGIGALAMAVFRPRASESSKLDAIKNNSISSEQTSGDRARGEADRGLAREEKDRWWLAEPFPLGNGGYR